MSICHSIKLLPIAALIGASLSGCFPMMVVQAVSNLSNDQERNDQETTVAQGAGAGVLLGAGIGYVIGGSSGALIGAAAGGLIGAGLGSSIAERKAQYANEEDFLIAEIRRNLEFSREADAENRQFYAEIARLDHESRGLAREYQADKASRDAMVQQKGTLEKQLAKAKLVNSLAEKQLADANEVYNDSRQKRGPQDRYTQQLESNVNQLKKTRQQSSQNVANLQLMYDGMSI